MKQNNSVSDLKNTELRKSNIEKLLEKIALFTVSRIPTTSSPSETTTTSTTSTTTETTTTTYSPIPSTTTELLGKCENGGILVENMCVCLNHFTGPRCEIPPYVENGAYAAYVQTRQPELLSFEMEGVSKMNTIDEGDMSMMLTTTVPDVLSTTEIPASTETSTTTSTSTTTTTTETTTLSSKKPIRGPKKSLVNFKRPKKPKTMTSSALSNNLTSDLMNYQGRGSDAFFEIVPLLKLSKYGTHDYNATRYERLYWPWFGKLHKTADWFKF